MIPKQKSKKQFSFDIKISNSNNKRQCLRNYSNLKETKDIFIRKQDIYLIKLLEKRIKLTKMLKNKKMEKNVIKIINPIKLLYHPDENKTTNNFGNNNKKIKQSINNYKNIKIKYNKNQYENISYINYEKDKINTLNFFDNLITSKIYNKDNSKNNKNMLKLITNNNFNYNYNFNTKNYFRTKYNNNSKIKLPKINPKNKTIRKNRKILNSEDSLSNYKTIVIKDKNNLGNNKNISLSEKGIFHENNSGINSTKKLQKNKYNFFYLDRSISPVKSK